MSLLTMVIVIIMTIITVIIIIMPTFSSSDDVDALPSTDAGLGVFSAVGTRDEHVCVG